MQSFTMLLQSRKENLVSTSQLPGPATIKVMVLGSVPCIQVEPLSDQPLFPGSARIGEDSKD